jgi:hypothetical protein
MIGLPHSSQNTRFLGRFAVWRRTSSMAACISKSPLLRARPRRPSRRSARCRCRYRPACAEPTKKPNARLKNLHDRSFLVGNGSDHEVRPSSENLAGLRGPGIGNDQAIAAAYFRDHVSTVFGAGHDTVQFAHAGQNDGSARLQASDSPRMMRVGHPFHCRGIEIHVQSITILLCIPPNSSIIFRTRATRARLRIPTPPCV